MRPAASSAPLDDPLLLDEGQAAAHEHPCRRRADGRRGADEVAPGLDSELEAVPHERSLDAPPTSRRDRRGGTEPARPRADRATTDKEPQPTGCPLRSASWVLPAASRSAPMNSSLVVLSAPAATASAVITSAAWRTAWRRHRLSTISIQRLSAGAALSVERGARGSTARIDRHQAGTKPAAPSAATVDGGAQDDSCTAGGRPASV